MKSLPVEEGVRIHSEQNITLWHTDDTRLYSKSFRKKKKYVPYQPYQDKTLVTEAKTDFLSGAGKPGAVLSNLWKEITRRNNHEHLYRR